MAGVAVLLVACGSAPPVESAEPPSVNSVTAQSQGTPVADAGEVVSATSSPAASDGGADAGPACTFPAGSACDWFDVTEKAGVITVRETDTVPSVVTVNVTNQHDAGARLTFTAGVATVGAPRDMSTGEFESVNEYPFQFMVYECRDVPSRVGFRRASNGTLSCEVIE